MMSTIRAVLISSGAQLESIGMPMLRRRHEEPDDELRDRILAMIKGNCFDKFVAVAVAQFTASKKA